MFMFCFRPHLGAAIHAQAWVLRRCISTFNLIVRKNCFPRDPEIRRIFKALDMEIPGSSREDLGSGSDGSLTDDGDDASSSSSIVGEGGEEEDPEVDGLVEPLSTVGVAPTPAPVEEDVPSGTVEEDVPTGTVEEDVPTGTVEEDVPTGTVEEDVPTGTFQEVASTESDGSKDVEASTEEPMCNFAAFIC